MAFFFETVHVHAGVRVIGYLCVLNQYRMQFVIEHEIKDQNQRSSTFNTHHGRPVFEIGDGERKLLTDQAIAYVLYTVALS